MKPKDTKSKILEAAIVLMGRSGAAGFSAAALAREVGISKATLFHHFKALDDIPLAALDLLSDQAMDLDLPENATLEQVLEAVGGMAFGFMEERRGFLNAYFTYVSKAMFDPRLKVKMQLSLNGAKAQVAGLFAGYVDDPKQASELGNMVMVLLDGAMMHMMLLENETEIQDMWAQFSALILKEFSDENSN